MDDFTFITWAKFDDDSVEGDFQKAAIDAVEDAAIITEDLIKDNSGAIVAKVDHV